MGRSGRFARVGWALILVASARAQDAPPSGAGPAGAGADTLDLVATRFYLHESYSTGPEMPKADAPEIGGYRVAFRERIVTTVEARQAAPKTEEQTLQAAYSERPTATSPIDDGRVTDAVRKYKSVKISPAPRGGAELCKDLLIWYRVRPGEPPLVMVLDPGRQLGDREYMIASRQLFVPGLALALPEQRPVRVGDKYTLTPAGVSALMGVPAQGTLTGTLESVRPEDASAPRCIAVLDIRGQVRLALGQAGVHAQIRFRFQPTSPRAASARDEDEVTVVNALGQVVKLALAQEVTGPAGPDGRLTRMIRRELVLERSFEGVDPALTVPRSAPEPTPENSWLVYRDPDDRFAMKHPQEYQTKPGDDADTVLLGHATPRGPEMITLSLRTLSPPDVDKLRSGRIAAWKAEGIAVADDQVGAGSKLPDSDWAPRRWSVYRFEAALPMAENGPPGAGKARLFFFGYVILTGRGPGFYVEATTPLNSPRQFRSQVEAILKTITIPGEAGLAPGAGIP